MRESGTLSWLRGPFGLPPLSSGWIRHRLRMLHLKQWKNGPNSYRQLRALGLSHQDAAKVAGDLWSWWRNSHLALNRALPPSNFDSFGCRDSLRSLSSANLPAGGVAGDSRDYLERLYRLGPAPGAQLPETTREQLLPVYPSPPRQSSTMLITVNGRPNDHFGQFFLL